jgi:hypothetical protein
MMKRLFAELHTLQRYWSVRLGAIVALFVGWIVDNPSVVPQIVNSLPQNWRPIASILAGFVTFCLPVFLRWLPQSGLASNRTDGGDK